MAFESVDQSRRNVTSLLAFVVGMVVGGGLYWAVGYYAWVEPVQGSGGSLLALVSIVGMFFGLIAPLTVVLYFGRNLEGVRRAAVIFAGYVVMVSFVGILAFAGVLQYLGIDSAVKAIGFIDAITGMAFGGIGGKELFERLTEK